jgi:hypothetical protein
MVVTTTPVRIRIISRSVACRVVGLTWVSYTACISAATYYVCVPVELALHGIYILPSGLCKTL